PPLPPSRPPRAHRPSTGGSTKNFRSSSSIGSTSPSASMLSIKAAYNNSIVVIRSPRDISLADLRKKLLDKFVKQEGVPLSEDFALAYALPASIPQPDKMDPSRARPRSSSMSSVNTVNSTVP